jgi:hypothetical protein
MEIVRKAENGVMAIVRERCRSCGSEVNVTVGQAIYDHELLWHKAYTCSVCGSSAEEDGRGRAPDEVRWAILQRDGEWALELLETDAVATKALKLLRQILNLSIAEVGELRRRLPGVLVTGTRIEVGRLMAMLSAERLKTSVVKLPTRPEAGTQLNVTKTD